jgi:uncharacterized membrane protein YgaE (UPF0421/DUF939 family)
MFKAELESLRLLFKSRRPSLRETLQVAALYSVQAAVCILLLEWGYSLGHFEGSIWAVISAILALQPGFGQSVVTSVLRILANTVGAFVALIIGNVPGLGPPEMRLILAIVIVVFTCELIRLDQAVRTACVAVIIVLTIGGETHFLISSGEERFFATIVGCGLAMIVQLVTDMIRERLKGQKRVIEPMRS